MYICIYIYIYTYTHNYKVHKQTYIFAYIVHCTYRRQAVDVDPGDDGGERVGLQAKQGGSCPSPRPSLFKPRAMKWGVLYQRYGSASGKTRLQEPTRAPRESLLALLLRRVRAGPPRWLHLTPPKLRPRPQEEEQDDVFAGCMPKEGRSCLPELSRQEETPQKAADGMACSLSPSVCPTHGKPVRFATCLVLSLLLCYIINNTSDM